MGQTTDQIEHHIEQTRETLGSNLQELEYKVKAVTDWKTHFQNHPMTMIGIAFSGGVILASLLGGRKINGAHHTANAPAARDAGVPPRKHEALEAWDSAKGALIRVLATRFKDYIGGIIRGFTEHYDRTQRRKRSSESSTSPDF